MKKIENAHNMGDGNTENNMVNSAINQNNGDNNLASLSPMQTKRKLNEGNGSNEKKGPNDTPFLTHYKQPEAIKKTLEESIKNNKEEKLKTDRDSLMKFWNAPETTEEKE